MTDLDPFTLNKLARQGEDDNKRLRQAIERTTRAPDRIVTIVNFGLGVTPGEQDGRSVVQIMQPNGEQLHLVFSPQARGALKRELEREEGAAGNGSSGAVELG